MVYEAAAVCFAIIAIYHLVVPKRSSIKIQSHVPLNRKSGSTVEARFLSPYPTTTHKAARVRIKLVGLEGYCAGNQYIVDEKGAAIGSSLHDTIYVKDSTISNHHGEIIVREDGAYVALLDGTGSVELNGQPVTHMSRLNPEDRLRFGSTSFLIEA